ncbi:CapA family protein [Pseudonocardia lacus]|uniref:CapA family protein n=1 Tax=Pseudonocardia lacus TaxID=2835865 RepID=UPI0027E2F7FC|nr:CapA family protein [Pseudonocardia lacus]
MAIQGHRRWAERAVIAAMAALSVAACGSVPATVPAPVPVVRTHPPTTTAAPPPPAAITVVATGDVLVHQRGPLVAGAAAAGRANGTGFDFRPVFADVAPLITAADLAVCHLETPVAGPEGPFRGYPSFSVQPQIVDALVAAGYDTCSTASNHSLDTGFDGLVRTLDTLDAGGLRHTGTFRSEAESRAPLVVDVGGVRVGHVSWTYGLNGVREPAERRWTVNDFALTGLSTAPDLTAVLADATAARAAGADIVIASVHCCTEYAHDPSPAQDAIAATLLASPDVDLVLGHHAHVVQPLERIGGEWVAHGLGNHLAQRSGRVATSDSVVVRFTFERGADGRFAATLAEAVPTRIRTDGSGVAVVRTAPPDPAHARVVEVLQRRGAAQAGLVITDR